MQARFSITLECQADVYFLYFCCVFAKPQTDLLVGKLMGNEIITFLCYMGGNYYKSLKIQESVPKHHNARAMNC